MKVLESNVRRHSRLKFRQGPKRNDTSNCSVVMRTSLKILDTVRQAFLAGIELFAGVKCGRECETHGLSTLHSTDILHSSQLNISDKTRIALTTRIDPGAPIFADDSLWFVGRWYSADGLLQAAGSESWSEDWPHEPSRRGEP
jgi:hypothetical protein